MVRRWLSTYRSNIGLILSFISIINLELRTICAELSFKSVNALACDARTIDKAGAIVMTRIRIAINRQGRCWWRSRRTWRSIWWRRRSCRNNWRNKQIQTDNNQLRRDKLDYQVSKYTNKTSRTHNNIIIMSYIYTVSQKICAKCIISEPRKISVN